MAGFCSLRKDLFAQRTHLFLAVGLVLAQEVEETHIHNVSEVQVQLARVDEKVLNQAIQQLCEIVA